MRFVSLHRAAGFAAVVGWCLLIGSLASASGAHEPSSTSRASGSGAAMSRAAATRVHHVSPTDAAGRLKAGYRVTRSARGYCWTSSFVNPELYRCFLGNYIQDPCWPRAGGHAVLCLLQPWSREVTRLRLTKRLPPTSPGHGSLWGLTLGSGQNCQESGGTHDIWRGHDVNYYCSRHWVLLDEPDRRSPAWHMATARYLHQHYHGRGVRRLSDAWRPKSP
jgi:hypothetical protein